LILYLPKENFFYRHQIESQTKISEISNQLVTTNGNINEQKTKPIEVMDVQVNRNKKFFSK
jgi:hypothetical protein